MRLKHTLELEKIPDAHVIISSTAVRALETGDDLHQDAEFVELDELYPPEGKTGEVLLAAAKRLGSSAPARQFMDDHECGEAFRNWCTTAWNGIVENISFGEEDVICVVGHHPCLEGMAALAAPEICGALLDTSLLNGNALVLTVEWDYKVGDENIGPDKLTITDYRFIRQPDPEAVTLPPGPTL